MTITVKWPALLVQGEKVTKEQAMEVIFRTHRWPLSCNEHKITDLYNSIVGFDSKIDIQSDLKKHWEKEDKIKDSLGILNLAYLHNKNIATCYIGGTCGWINWNGNIFSNTTNIGKWPLDETVLRDWKIIAETFPFLNLRCQLLNNESCEDFTDIACEYIVANGKVEYIDSPPGKPMIPCVDGLDEFSFLFKKEIGCSEDTLKKAFNICKSRKK